VWSYTSIPIRLHGVVLSQAQGQLYLLRLSVYPILTRLLNLLTLVGQWELPMVRSIIPGSAVQISSDARQMAELVAGAYVGLIT
jgi:hypothetical protein